VTEQQQAMQELRQHQFAMIDAGLYLDSHPDDEMALQYFRTMAQKKQQAEEAYVKHFAPLSMYASGQGTHWSWVDEPWPWEGE
jgi:spore coat protein JB